jgi:hypothetical protein
MCAVILPPRACRFCFVVCWLCIAIANEDLTRSVCNVDDCTATPPAAAVAVYHIIGIVNPGSNAEVVAD